jgi:hypothetical protein
MRYAQINSDGICFADSILADQVISSDLIELQPEDSSPLGNKWEGGVWTAVQVPPPAIIDRFAFTQRFTFTERSGILAAAKTDIEVETILHDLSDTAIVDLTSPALTLSLDLLVTKNLLTAARKTEILTP